MKAQLILGDCRQQLAELMAADAVLTDPPYGIGYRVNARHRASGTGLKATPATETSSKPVIAGDNVPFDPTIWLARWPEKAAFFGAQHFSDSLPAGRWVVWDKRRESAPDSHSDCEMVWLGGDTTEATRIHRQKWRGVVREGEENCSRSKKLHQNQKPVALLTYLLGRLGLAAGDTVCDPYMGSGSTAIAALRLGINFVGVELDQAHYLVAKHRIEAEFGTGIYV